MGKRINSVVFQRITVGKKQGEWEMTGLAVSGADIGGQYLKPMELKVILTKAPHFAKIILFCFSSLPAPLLRRLLRVRPYGPLLRLRRRRAVHA